MGLTIAIPVALSFALKVLPLQARETKRREFKLAFEFLGRISIVGLIDSPFRESNAVQQLAG
jgi:hypothetical protein